MKKISMFVCIALFAFGFTAQANDALLEKLMLLRIVDEFGVSEFEMVEILNGYTEYRDAMDDLTAKRAEKCAELKAAIDADENASRLSALTRELMAIDMNILRTKQGAVNEAADVLDAKSVAQLYLVVSDMAAAKDALLAELTGKSQITCPVTGMTCPMPAAPAQSPEEAIMERGMLSLNKLLEKDFDGAFAAVADDFQHHEWAIRTKSHLREFLEQAAAMGFLDDIEINFDDTVIKIEGNKVTAYPVEVVGVFGSGTLELVGELRNGEYMLTTLDAFGL